MAKRRRMWKNREVRYLKSGARRQITARKMARRLRRTEGAVRQKAFAIGLSLETRNISA